jgi:hypothetical protein
MVVGVELYYFEMGLENGRFSVLTFRKKSRSKFVRLGEPVSCAIKAKELHQS